MDYGICTCSKHNYTGTSTVCPYCCQEQQDNQYKRLYALEKRRRVAAEAVIEEAEKYCAFPASDKYQLWQSIKKEAGDE